MAKLKCSLHPLLTEDFINRLRRQNILTVFDFVQEETDKLMKIIRLSFKDIIQLKETIFHEFGGKVENPSKLLVEPETILSTGIMSLDQLLDDGLRPGQIYEICGQSSSGKTQLCLCLSANVSTNSAGIVHYIDTSKEFSAERIQMILESRSINDEEIGRSMTKIQVTHVQSSMELFNVLYEFTTSFKCTLEASPKILIIDSLSNIFSFTSDVKSNISVLSALNQLANVCRFLANEYRLPIVTTNLINKWREADSFGKCEEGSQILKSTLGKYWSSVPNTRFFIEKRDREDRIMTVWKSHYIKRGSSVKLVINNTGFV